MVLTTTCYTARGMITTFHCRIFYLLLPLPLFYAAHLHCLHDDDLVEKLPHLSIWKRQCHCNATEEKTTVHVHFCFSIRFVSFRAIHSYWFDDAIFVFKMHEKSIKISFVFLRMRIYCLIFYHWFIEQNANARAAAATVTVAKAGRASAVAKLRCCKLPLNAMSLVFEVVSGGWISFVS